MDRGRFGGRGGRVRRSGLDPHLSLVSLVDGGGGDHQHLVDRRQGGLDCDDDRDVQGDVDHPGEDEVVDDRLEGRHFVDDSRHDDHTDPGDHDADDVLVGPDHLRGIVTDPTMHRFGALGTICEIGVTDPRALDPALAVVAAELAACDLACSRFRDDSDLSRLNAGAGSEVGVSLRLIDDLAAALRAAEVTAGLVDPTVGEALVLLGYDVDFDLIARQNPNPPTPAARVTFRPVPGWRAVRIDRRRQRAFVPRGVRVDLGATAKARCADLAAAAAAAAAGCGVLVNLGGDLTFAGTVPDGGWRIKVTDRTSDGLDAAGQTVALRSGALATSSVTARTWQHGGRRVHHVVDPRTGGSAPVVWRTASVTAATCLDANIAATASIILGDEAPAWLTAKGLSARLVAGDGTVTAIGGWPREPQPSLVGAVTP
jgi:thiamine biosynthesis lipoprotein